MPNGWRVISAKPKCSPFAFLHFREQLPEREVLEYTLAPPTANLVNMAVSPDGRHLVFNATDQSGPRLWVRPLDSLQTQALTGTENATHPFWSPDGCKVAFASTRSGLYDLFQRSSNGTGQDELLFESKASNFPSDWSRDGKFLIFTSQGGKTSDDLWALPMTGSAKPGDREPILLLQTPFAETQGQLSPDSRWLAYTSNEAGRPQVYVQPFAPGWDQPITGKWQVSTSGGFTPRWRGDGKELFYLSTDEDRKLMAVEVKAGAQTFDRGTPQALFASRLLSISTIAFGYAVTSDGKRFLMAVAAGTPAETSPLTVVVN